MSQLFSGQTDELRQFVPVNVNFTMAGLMPSLVDVENTVLPRFLGLELIARVIDLKNQNGLDENGQRTAERALQLTQATVARLGFVNYLPFAELQIDDDGLTVTAASGRKAAFEYQTNKLSRVLTDSGWESLDQLLSLLGRYPDLFPEWADAPYNQEQQNALIVTPAEFSQYYPIQDRWLTFWALRPTLRYLEEERGYDAQARIDALPDVVTTATRNRLGRTLRRALAYQTVIDALPTLSIQLDGVNVRVNYGSQYGNTDYYQPPGKDQLAFVTSTLQRQADLAWNSFESLLATLEPPTTPDEEPTTGNGPQTTGAMTLL